MTSNGDLLTRCGEPLDAEWTSVVVRGRVFCRIVVRTRWLGPTDSLPEVIDQAVADRVRAGDTVVVSEKVALLLTGCAVSAAGMRPGWLARALARGVQPIGNSRGLSIPEKMQYVIDRRGWVRVGLAGCAAALTRPLGIRGVFYRLAGTLARDLDGLRPPYEDLLLPPLPTSTAAYIAQELQSAVGVGVAIVDINDRGGSVRAASSLALRPELLLDVLADNPLGQRDQSTPVGVIRDCSSSDRLLPAK